MNPTATTSSDLKALLKTHFGFDDFRPNQQAIIKAVINKEDVITIMPTGGGKSLCFQLAALALPGTAIVVSPLISLMKDQVDALNANGISAAYFNSSQPASQQQDVLKKLEQNALKLLYLAPESLGQVNFLFNEITINLFAIDEAHCISSWGHDFRPAYQQLGHLKTNFPSTPIIALTATADRATRKDIANQLTIPHAKTFIASFDRPNLYLDVRPGRQRKEQILRFLKRHADESGIIYCLSRKNTEKLAATLVRKGYNAQAYHAGLAADKRSEIQENFSNDVTPIVVATIAFGMGIDKSNVRWVIHYNLPKNIEGYYQEIGRAGRDGLAAHTILFHSYSDIRMLRNFAEDSANSEFQLAKLNRMQQFAESLNCRRKMLLGYFGEHLTKDCGHCDNCKNPPHYFDGTLIAQKVCSAVARLKEREAAGLVVDVLRGAETAQVFEKGYQNIKTYGAAKAISWKNLHDYVIQLVNQGILEIWFHEGGRLVLTPLAKTVLFDGKTVKLANIEKHNAEAQSKFTVPEKHHQRGKLFDLLKTKRRAIASEKNIPPYAIFNDASLEDMEARMPQTTTEFSDIYGVGQAKLNTYGATFIAVIKQFIASHPKKKPSEKFDFGNPLEPVGATRPKRQSRTRKSHKTLHDKLEDLCDKLLDKNEKKATIPTHQDLDKLANTKPRQVKSFQAIDLDCSLKHQAAILKVINRHLDEKGRKRPSHEHSYDLFMNHQMSVQEVASHRGLSENTIYGHLLKMYLDGHKLAIQNFISQDEIDRVQQAKKKLDNPDSLKVYFDYFDQALPYWKLRWGLDLGK